MVVKVSSTTPLNVLIGGEFSGVVRDAFIARGHNAISCDLLPTEVPGPHYQGDFRDLLTRGIWDIIIMHPDCTAVCNAGNKHYGQGKRMYYERLAAVYFIAKLWGRCRMICKKVAFENPPGVLTSMAGLPPAKFVQPYEHGHLEQKRTGFHLHGLEPLAPTNDVYLEMMKLERHEREAVFYMGPKIDAEGNDTRWMDRARTYTGIAAAMAAKWG